MERNSTEAAIAPPVLSLVMPCYNEGESVEITVRRLIDAFEAAGHRLELVVVNNGSLDHTGEVLERLERKYPENVRPHKVEVNQGYGHGILSGIPHCRASWIGFIPADGQVDAEDVVRLYEAAAASSVPVVAKARRRFRMDGLTRKLISVSYNLAIRLLWPRLDSLDVNGTPKILPREMVQRMELKTTGWFLDPEIMIKAHYLGLRVMELNVFARMRGNGVSHVRMGTCWEFARNLLVFRFSPEMTRWKRAARGARSADAPVLASSRTRS